LIDRFQEILPWESFIPGSVVGKDDESTSDSSAGGASIIAIMTFFSYIIVLNTLVPISLYVRSATDPHLHPQAVLTGGGKEGVRYYICT